MLSYFTKQLKLIKINNKKYLNKHKKLVGAKLARIKEYLEKSKFNIFKLMTFVCISEIEKGVLEAFQI